MKQVRKMEAIEYVEEDQVVRAQVTWGLDRVDQRDLPLDDSYNPPSGKHVYMYGFSIWVYFHILLILLL